MGLRKRRRPINSCHRKLTGHLDPFIFSLQNLLPFCFQDVIFDGMTRHSWITNHREDGLPLLDAIGLRIPAAQRGFLRQLIRKQRVLLNDSPAEESASAHSGDRLALQPSARLDALILESRLNPAQLLYEDKLCIVIDKPSGLASHPAEGHDHDLLSDLRTFLRFRHETFQVSPIHRLDIGTSGPVLFGKGRAAISTLGKMLMAGESRKHYLALVCGQPPRSGVLDSTITMRGKQKEALTRFHCRAPGQNHALLELELITGRRHQIRQQLAEAGWPIAGDSRYRGEPLPGMGRPFLHCLRLAFRRPSDDRVVEVASPLPADLSAQLSALGIDLHRFPASAGESPPSC